MRLAGVGIAVFRPAALLLALSLSACATFSDSIGVIERNLALNQPADALAALEGQRHARRDEVLYLLNKAMLLRIDGRYADSNAAFETAKQRIAVLSATSVTEQTASFLINDATRAYIAEPFEQVLIHLYMALNYLSLGSLDAARVEALQVDLRLREHAELLPESRYREGALARYLTGKIYEEHGEWSDALIAYRKAFEAYEIYRKDYGTAMPTFLTRDLVRMAKRQGLTEEVKRYRAKLGDDDSADSIRTMENAGELVFFLHAGLAPIKREGGVTVLNPANGRFIRISQPYYERRFLPLGAGRITVGKQTAAMELAEDIDAVAQKTLESQLPAITARSIARAVAKDQTAREAGKQDNALGLVVNIANVLTERADTRSWVTLPGRIYVAVMPLPPGTHTVRLELPGTGMAVREFADVAISPGKKTYLSYHWIPPETAGRR